MAVSGITASNALLLSALVGRQGGLLRSPPVPAGRAAPNQATTAAATLDVNTANPNVQQVKIPLPALPNVVPTAGAAAAVADPVPDALQQNALLINEILRNLSFTPAAAPPFDTRSPFFTALQQTQDLSPLQQNALLVNEALAGLGLTAAAPASPLLIDVIPPALEALGVSEDLGLIPQNALFVSQTLQGFGVASPSGTVAQPPIASVPTATAAVAEATVAPAAVAITPAAAVTGAISTAVAAPGPAVAPVTPGAGAAVILPATERLLSVGYTPATLPYTRFPDRTPYVLAVYHVQDPAPPPSDPAPISEDVRPVSFVGGVRSVGNARLRQVLLRAREDMREADEYGTAALPSGPAEKSIRSALGRVNDDMVSRALPWHLVLARNEDGLALDVYDCSANDACRVSYDVPIALDNLPGFLDSLEHETGIIVDTIS